MLDTKKLQQVVQDAPNLKKLQQRVDQLQKLAASMGLKMEIGFYDGKVIEKPKLKKKITGPYLRRSPEQLDEMKQTLIKLVSESKGKIKREIVLEWKKQCGITTASPAPFYQILNSIPIEIQETYIQMPDRR